MTRERVVPLSPQLRDAFVEGVRGTLGLVFPPSRAWALDQGVAHAVAALSEGDAAALLDRLLRGDPAARDALVAELTVGETYFFRDDNHFAFVRDVAIPEAMRRGGSVRLWSAGCATGEEAWSLAITAREALGADASRVEVIGTDLNAAFIERARRGWYGRWSFRGVDPARQERWFVPERGGWSVAPEVRPTVRFAEFNLMDADAAAWPCGVDVIFCRNVAIYFDMETVERLAARLARSLHEGGWLVPGPSDPLLPDGLGLVATIRGPLVYRRTGAVAPGAVAPGAVAPAAVLVPVAPPQSPTPFSRRSPVPSLHRRLTPSTAGSIVQMSAPLVAAQGNPAARARALADAGDLAKATRLLNGALVQDGLDPALYLLRSTVRQASGDERGACDDAEKAVLLDRTLSFAHVLSATSRARLGDVAAARRSLRNARELLLRAADDAPVRYADAETRRSLLALCDRLARTLGGPALLRRRST